MTTENIETLGLEYQGVGHTPRCDLCDIEPTIVDKEWMAPDQWRRTYRCPSCERETAMTNIGNASLCDTSEVADRIATEYVESEMSEESLERSLDRVYGLREK